MSETPNFDGDDGLFESKVLKERGDASSEVMMGTIHLKDKWKHDKAKQNREFECQKRPIGNAMMT